MTGALQVNAPIFGYNYSNSNNAPAFVFDKNGGNYTGIGSHNEADVIWFGAASYSNGTATWVDSYKQKWKFNGTIFEDGTSLADKYQPKGNYLTTHQDISGKLDKSGGEMTGNLALTNAALLVQEDSADFVAFEKRSAGGLSIVMADGEGETGYVLENADDGNTHYIATKDWVSNQGYLTAHQSLTGCVPYSGATQDVNIEGHDFWADDIYSQGDIVATRNWVSTNYQAKGNSLTSHKTYYEHNLLIFVANNGYFINLRLITDSATALTTYAGLVSALNSAGYTSNLKTLLCSGSVYASGKTMMATGIFVQNANTLYARGIILAQRSSSTLTITESPSSFASTALSSSSFNIQDYVRTL
jgi:hypothetical protein